MDNGIVFSAPSHGDILALITQLAVLLFTARLFGEIALRRGQPAVVGELLAGIFLGPSCLGSLFPFIEGYIIPATPVQGYLLDSIGLLGALFLLLITGIETDINLIRRQAKTAVGTAIGGLIVPFATGFLLGQYLPDSLLAKEHERLVFSLFIATAMSISAIPVIAKVLMEMKLIRRDIGQIILAAGMIDDTTGWVLLSIIAGLASGHNVTTMGVLQAVGTVFIFIAISFTIGRWVTKRAVDFVQDFTSDPEKTLSLVVVCMFTWAALSHALHLEPVLGAFLMGILIGQLPRLPQVIHQRLQSIALSIFAPIFFAVAGLKVNLLNLLRPDLILIAILVIFVATFGKVVGTYLGARLIAKQNHWVALSFGAALNARGAMEIIVATIGMKLGILTQEMFSIVVLMAIVTSLMAPSALRWALKNVIPSEEELKRLHKEELARDSSIESIRRVLVPLRARESEIHLNTIQVIKSRIIEIIGRKTDLEVTLVSVDKTLDKAENAKFLEQTAALFKTKKVNKKVVASSDALNKILDESKKDYDLLVLGASEQKIDSNYLFTKLIDSLVRLAPCMTMVVHSRNIEPDWHPRRILVPTNGSLAARHAAEFAFLMSSSDQQEIVLLNVIEKPQKSLYVDVDDEIFKNQLKIADAIVKELKELGTMRNARASGRVRSGADAESVVLEVASDEKFDLIVLGSDVRLGSGRLYLGSQVERILRNAPCPVVIINAG